MNILEHPIYKDIYDLCQEIEKLPASEQETKCVFMASNLEKPAAQLVNALKEIRTAIEKIVVVAGEDSGVILLSDDSPATLDKQSQLMVYDHEHFSPLGDALVALHRLTDLPEQS